MSAGTETIVLVRFTDEGASVDLDAAVLTSRLKLEPSRTWKKGDVIGKWRVNAKVSGWELASGLPKQATLRDHFAALQAQTLIGATALREAAVNWNGTLVIVQYVAGSGQELHLEKEVVHWASTLGLAIAVDTYSLAEPD